MQLDYAILADGVSTRPDGKFDISGAGWDTIHADAVPATHARLTLVVRLLISRAEAEHPHSLIVVRKLIELGYERALRQTFLGSSVRLGPDQLPRIWEGR